MENITIFTKPTKKAEAVERALLVELKKHKVKPKNHVVVAIGGDGTLLMAIKKFMDQDVCFVGISAGHLGFLQTLDTKQVPELVKTLRDNSYSTIQAPLLSVSYADGNDSNSVIGYGFDDLTVERFGPRAAKFSLKIDNASGHFIGDGVIFATPLGSTAYSLAAGGPIVDARSEDVFLVTPNNPHISTLYSSLQRPHVLQKGRVVRIDINKDDAIERPIQLSIDGQVAAQVLTKSIEVALSDKTISLLELNPNDFHSRIDAKRLGSH